MLLFWLIHLFTIVHLIFFHGVAKAEDLLSYHKDNTLVSAFLRHSGVSSIQICIHKCNINAHCNMVSVNLTSSTNFECLFGWIQCFERLEDKVKLAKGWDTYVFRKQVEKPFNLAYRGTSRIICSKINSDDGKLALRDSCSEFFCISSKGHMVNISSRKCLTLQFIHSAGAHLILKAACNGSAIFREAEGYGVQEMKSKFYLHPEASHSQPPSGIRVVAWESGKYPFFFKYADDFL